MQRKSRQHFIYLFDRVAVVVVAVKPNPPSIVVLFRDVDKFVENPPNAGGAELCTVAGALAPNVKPVDMLFEKSENIQCVFVLLLSIQHTLS